MRFARRLFVLAVAAVAAMAFASPALAQTEVEVSTEPGAEHCPAVTMAGEGHGISGGCLMHATSVGQVVFFNGGSPIMACSSEFEARVDEFGHGYIYDQVFTGPQCIIEPCTEDPPTDNEQEEWEFQIDEPNGSSAESERLTFAFCISPVGDMATKVRCELEIGTTDLDDHDYRFATSQGATGTACHPPNPFSLRGVWDLEYGDDHEGEVVEIHHEDDEAG
jgi:hypothetical protein